VNTERATVKRLITRILIVLAVVWLAACGVLYGIMRRPPETFGRFMAKIPGPVAFLVLPFETLWLRARSGGLQVGDAAPDFLLTKLDKTGQIQLASFSSEHRPVVLVFGSYT